MWGSRGAFTASRRAPTLACIWFVQAWYVPRGSPTPCARLCAHRPRVRLDSRSKQAIHHRDTGQYTPHVAGSPPAQFSVDSAGRLPGSLRDQVCADNAVEPTKSQNITVSWRRSAARDWGLGIGGLGFLILDFGALDLGLFLTLGPWTLDSGLPLPAHTNPGPSSLTCSA